ADGDDAVDVRLRLGSKRLGGKLLNDLHRAIVAQVGEAGMHLRGHRPGARALPRILRPEALAGELLVEILADRQRIPDGDFAVDQRGHPSARGILADVPGGVRHVEGNDDLLVRNRGELESQPPAQRPGGVLLVSDDDLEHGSVLITRAAPQREPSYHDAARGNLGTLRWQTRASSMQSLTGSSSSTARWAQPCSGC